MCGFSNDYLSSRDFFHSISGDQTLLVGKKIMKQWDEWKNVEKYEKNSLSTIQPKTVSSHFFSKK